MHGYSEWRGTARRGPAKPAFDVEIKESLADGKILTVTIDNPVITVEREGEDAALTGEIVTMPAFEMTAL